MDNGFLPGLSKKHLIHRSKNCDSVAAWWIELSDYPFYQHTPWLPAPKLLAQSYGSLISAKDAIIELFETIPFYYRVYTGILDTLKGLQKRLKRMRTPESLYKNRCKRIEARLQKTDPLFYDQMIDKALFDNPYTLEWYQKIQREKASMNETVAASKTEIGTLWINPEAEWMQNYDWV